MTDYKQQLQGIMLQARTFAFVLRFEVRMYGKSPDKEAGEIMEGQLQQLEAALQQAEDICKEWRATEGADADLQEIAEEIERLHKEARQTLRGLHEIQELQGFRNPPQA